MADVVTLLVVGGVLYYLFATGTIDTLAQQFTQGGAGAGGTSGYTPPSGGGGGYKGSSRTYKPPSGGYSRGGGGYNGSPGWYTSGPNGSGHHHCTKGQADCWCTDPGKCVAQAVAPGPGQCRPEFGTKEYLGGGPYPSQAQLPQEIAKCPAGSHA